MNDKPKVIIFNGPPRSGKDEAVNFLLRELPNSHRRSYKDALIELTARMLNLEVEEFLEGYNDECDWSPTGWMKDYIQYMTGPHNDPSYFSQRSALIHMSEEVIKPVFGERAFGDALVKRFPDSGVVLIPDGGFTEEVYPIIEKVGWENILIVKLHREGCSFDGDSRDYLPRIAGVQDVSLYQRML